MTEYEKLYQSCIYARDRYISLLVEYSRPVVSTRMQENLDAAHCAIVNADYYLRKYEAEND